MEAGDWAAATAATASRESAKAFMAGNILIEVRACDILRLCHWSLTTGKGHGSGLDDFRRNCKWKRGA